MRQSRLELHAHIVWATYRRAGLITPAVEPGIYRRIAELAREKGATVHNVNGMPDHVHVVVTFPATVSIAELVKSVKGASSRFANAGFRFEEPFRWQERYSAFSVSRSHLARVIAYVENQKRHHADGTTWPEWEETDEEVEQVDEAHDLVPTDPPT